MFAFLMGATTYAMQDVPLPVVISVSAGIGVFFGHFMGLFFTHQAQDAAQAYGYPIGTEHRHAVASQLLLIQGLPGPDPITNEVARKQAEMALGTPYHPWGLGLLFSTLALLSAGMAFRHHLDEGLGFPVVIFSLFALLCALLPAVMIPLERRKRRRAADFLDALEG